MAYQFRAFSVVRGVFVPCLVALITVTSAASAGGGGGAGGQAAGGAAEGGGGAAGVGGAGGEPAVGGGGAGPSDKDGDGYTIEQGDCDDLDWNVSPDAKEDCNGRDDDCDGVTDNPVEGAHPDSDGDGYGDPDVSVTVCSPGYVSDDTDCNDLDASIHPGAMEYNSDNIDSNCDRDYTLEDPNYDSGFGAVPNAISAGLLAAWMGVGAWRRRRAAAHTGPR